MYGVTNAELAACNNLPLNKPLKVGTVLVIPPGGEANYTPPPSVKKKSAPKKSKPAKKPRKAAKPVTGSDGTYSVQSGDSLWKIARRYNITTKSLIEANGINPKTPLRIGQKLVIPGVQVKPKPATVEVIKEKAIVIEEKPKKPEINPIDDLLNDAEKAAGETGDNEEAGNAKDVLSGLDSAAATTEVPLADDLYTEEVLPNETLPEIAERHGLKIEELLKVNPGLKVNQKLKPFTSIKIPNKKY